MRGSPAGGGKRCACHKCACGCMRGPPAGIQILLQAKTHQSVFVGSDDLQEPDTLFDTVLAKIGQPVVYLTRDTLTRTWFEEGGLPQLLR